LSSFRPNIGQKIGTESPPENFVRFCKTSQLYVSERDNFSA